MGLSMDLYCVADQANSDSKWSLFRHCALPYRIWAGSGFLCCLRWLSSGCGEVQNDG